MLGGGLSGVKWNLGQQPASLIQGMKTQLKESQDGVWKMDLVQLGAWDKGRERVWSFWELQLNLSFDYNCQDLHGNLYLST